MKLLFSLALILFSFCAHASVNFTYSETPEYVKPNLIDILEIESELEEQGYLPVDLSHEQKLHIVGIDQAFFDVSAKKHILLKFGQKVSDPTVVGQLIPFLDGFIFHGENPAKVPYALLFLNHSEFEARAVVKPLGLQTKVSLLKFLIPEAGAACPRPVMLALSRTVSNPQIAQGLWNCALAYGTGNLNSLEAFLRAGAQFRRNPEPMLKAAGQAIRNTGAAVGSFLAAGALFRRNPQLAWERTQRSYNEMAAYFVRLGEGFNSLRACGLDTNTALQAMCTVAGELTPGFLSSLALGANAGSALRWAIPAIALKLSKIRSLMPVLRRLSDARRSGLIRNSEAVERVVSCAR